MRAANAHPSPDLPTPNRSTSFATGSPDPTSSRSTPNSCARTPIWPDLCLVQIADDKEAAAIDPKAEGIDLTPLLDLLVNNEDVLKVFHAGGQDIEIVFNLTGRRRIPLFDTQIAAMALGLGEQVGYSNLVESLLGISLDKGARFTDWARRPLDKRQIDYAIGDVTHLAEIFPQMLEQLRKTGRGDWLDQEMERLADPANYANDPAQAWKRVTHPEPQGRGARPAEGARRLARARGAVARICRAAGS